MLEFKLICVEIQLSVEDTIKVNGGYVFDDS